MNSTRTNFSNLFQFEINSQLPICNSFSLNTNKSFQLENSNFAEKRRHRIPGSGKKESGTENSKIRIFARKFNWKKKRTSRSIHGRITQLHGHRYVDPSHHVISCIASTYHGSLHVVTHRCTKWRIRCISQNFSHFANFNRNYLCFHPFSSFPQNSPCLFQFHKFQKISEFSFPFFPFQNPFSLNSLFSLSQFQLLISTFNFQLSTWKFNSTELLRNEDYEITIDYWSLGVIFFELVNGVPPFYDDTPGDVFKNIFNYQEVLRCLCESIDPAVFSLEARDFLNRYSSWKLKFKLKVCCASRECGWGEMDFRIFSSILILMDLIGTMSETPDLLLNHRFNLNSTWNWKKSWNFNLKFFFLPFIPVFEFHLSYRFQLILNLISTWTYSQLEFNLKALGFSGSFVFRIAERNRMERRRKRKSSRSHFQQLFQTFRRIFIRQHSFGTFQFRRNFERNFISEVFKLKNSCWKIQVESLSSKSIQINALENFILSFFTFNLKTQLEIGKKTKKTKMWCIRSSSIRPCHRIPVQQLDLPDNNNWKEKKSRCRICFDRDRRLPKKFEDSLEALRKMCKPLKRRKM